MLNLDVMIKDCVYFFTASINHHIPVFYNNKNCEVIYESLNFLDVNKKATIYGFVIMPNHIHLMIKPLTDNLKLSFMRFTGQQILFNLKKSNIELLKRFETTRIDRKYQIWGSTHVFEIYTEKMFLQKLDYIHNNPVSGNWMLGNTAIKYPHSSIRYYELNEENEFAFITHFMNEGANIKKIATIYGQTYSWVITQ